uniref:SET domain-containing protein n=4 Tax=Clytia hemisphaerica TaxID=252671 RepID=A0A7M6DJE2_9CNID
MTYEGTDYKTVYLCIYAKKTIPKGCEIRYDYGDRDEACSWRLKEKYQKPLMKSDLLQYQMKEAKQFVKDANEVNKDSNEVDKNVLEVEKNTNKIDKDTNEVEKNANVVDKDTNVVDKDTNEVEKNTNEVEKNTNEVEKNANVVDKDTNVVDKDTNVVDKDTNVVDKDTNVVDKDTNEVEKNANVVDKDTNVVDKDTNEVEKNANVVDKDTNVVDKDTNEVEKNTNEVEVKKNDVENGANQMNNNVKEMCKDAGEMEKGANEMKKDTYMAEKNTNETEKDEEDVHFDISEKDTSDAESIIFQPLKDTPKETTIPTTTQVSDVTIEDTDDEENSRDDDALADNAKCFANLRRSVRTIRRKDYQGMDSEESPLGDLNDPDFLLDFDDEPEEIADPDAALEKAIAKMNELCGKFEEQDFDQNPYRASSPVNEMEIKNDSAIGLGMSVGEIIDTSQEEPSQHHSENTPENHSENTPENHSENTPENQPKNATENQPKKKKKRPKRPCPFGCKKLQSVLSRHLKLMHKDEPAIIEILSKPKELHNKCFDNLKKEGIFKYNQQEMTQENPNYMRERIPKISATNVNNIVICSECKGTYSKGFKSRHQIECGKTGGRIMIPMVPVKDMVITEYPPEFKEVINKMKIDEISSLAKTDPFILVVGARIFNGNKCKEEKIQEVNRRVRSSMRLLSRLLLKFNESFGSEKTLSSLFDRENLKHLRFAIDALSENEDEVKAGLKVQIQNVIKLAAKTLEAHFLVEAKKELSEMVCEFMKVFHLVEDELFNGALYKIKQKRNKSTRKPGNLPDEEIVQDLKSYLLGIIRKDQFIFKQPSEVYVNVRDAACARLTIFNGRRGGEPARLFTYQWQEAIDGIWLRPEKREQYKREVNTKNRITYQEGKGEKQVCVFIPPDTVDAMIFLCDDKVRSDAGVSSNNKYAFPSTGNSLLHCEGWQSLTTCCKKAGIESKINGTLNRHRVSSIMGAFNLTETDRNLSYDHFGHSEEMNRFVYQIPQAEQQLAKTGEYLSLIDKNQRPSNSEGLDSQMNATTSSQSTDQKKTTTNNGERKHPRRKRKAAAVESDHSSSDSEDDPIQTMRTFKWSEPLKLDFIKTFGGFVRRTEKRKMPTKEEMMDFMKKNGEDERLYGKVKIRINNERNAIKKKANKEQTEIDKRVAKRAKEMEM